MTISDCCSEGIFLDPSSSLHSESGFSSSVVSVFNPSYQFMLYEFYGDTCPHCIVMKSMVEKLEKELGLTVEKFEVWNNEENAKKMEEIDRGLCGGVPFFYNTDSEQFICGSADEETLRKWMKGEKVA